MFGKYYRIIFYQYRPAQKPPLFHKDREGLNGQRPGFYFIHLSMSLNDESFNKAKVIFFKALDQCLWSAPISRTQRNDVAVVMKASTEEVN